MVCRVLNDCRTTVTFAVSRNLNEIECCTKFRGEICIWYRWKGLALGSCSKVKAILAL